MLLATEARAGASDMMSPHGEGWVSSSERSFSKQSRSPTRVWIRPSRYRVTAQPTLLNEEADKLEGPAYTIRSLPKERWLPTVFIVPDNIFKLRAEPRHQKEGPIEPGLLFPESQLPEVHCRPFRWQRFDREYVCVGRSIDCFQPAGGFAVNSTVLVPLCRCSRVGPMSVPSYTGLFCLGDHTITRPLQLACRRIHRGRAVDCVGRDHLSHTGWFNTTPAVETSTEAFLRQRENMMRHVHF
ncbi:hypothetical protein GQ602_002391 [Ophiocordyceps camponoti-floridani]|uniref:Uncharacterized protein n=1 Tax=Ophiocordyceps camponoti-floridani TaxID=2030778 RepID=A0A8H4VFD3_9HYPO|nr:hypothetical protein GQ602_002391 [Ophiocordyceps camponoti-floridani]